MENKKQYTNTWFAERGGKTWDNLLRKRNIKNALEVGCYEGQASVYLLEKIPGLYLDVVDIFDADAAEDWDGYTNVDKKHTTTYEDRFDNNVKPYNKRVSKYKGKSFKHLIHLYEYGYRYDFIYIDGDHRALPALQDCAIAIELLNNNGIMVIDDYADIPWLKDAIDKFVSLLPSEKYKYKTTEDGSQMVVYRIA